MAQVSHRRPIRVAASTSRSGLTLGPRDVGRRMTLGQYLRCVDAPGYKVDIVDGEIRVSPSGEMYHQLWQMDIAFFLNTIARQHPACINFVFTDNDVVVPFRPGPTRPRPDVSAYRGMPPLAEWGPNPDWADFCPILVVEIISKRHPLKDIKRNREMYWSAGGIAEYWIIDPRKAPLEPGLTALLREAGAPDWRETRVAFGDAWKSPSLGGLALNLRDVRRESREAGRP